MLSGPGGTDGPDVARPPSSGPPAGRRAGAEAADEPGGGPPADGLRRRLAEAEAEAEKLRIQVDSTEWLAMRYTEQETELAKLGSDLSEAQAAIGRLQGQRIVRYASRARRVLGRAKRAVVRPPTAPSPAGVDPPLREPSASFAEDRRYEAWVACYDTVDDDARRAIRARLSGLRHRPLVSVILPVYNSPQDYLRQAIDSVVGQLYENWELCIVDDCSTAPWVPKILEEYATDEPRIRVERRDENGHISASSNTALAMAKGEWVALFDHDDLMAEHALALAVLALDENPDAGVLYSDEDKIDEDGRRFFPFFKPDFDPVLLLGENCVSHLCLLRRDLVEAVGGYRLGYEGSQDWDLVLRVVETLQPDQVVHVPHVLYHWRVHAESTAGSVEAKPYAASAGQRAVSDHLSRTGRSAAVQLIGGTGFNRVRWALPDPAPPVSIVVLPRSGPMFLRCLDSVRLCSTYPAIELVVVDDGTRRPPLRQFLRDRQGGMTVVRVQGDSTDSALRNVGARASKGDVVCFLHDDVEVLTGNWLEELVGLLLQPGMGAVGAKLLYPGGAIQHAGLVAGIGGTVGNAHRFVDRLEPGYVGRAMLAQCFSAVSWACMAVRREAFDAVDGFDEGHLAGLFGDADFCFRLGEAGWQVGWTPHAELLHHESTDEGRGTDGENAVRFARDIRYLQERWRPLLDRDPAYNPNLSVAHETFPMAWPPRVSYR